ncbi:MAG: ribose-phosphate pyrophosphokinase, partial [Gemmatimonadota bacterium]
VSEAAAALKRLGARRVYCCATHALLSGPAVQRLRDAPIEENAVTNTIAVPADHSFEKLRVLSVGGLLAQAIANTHRDKSVSSLFD